MFPLHKLQVYAQAIDLAHACTTQTRDIRDVELRSQLVRAARSIAANLAEGAGSETQAAFAKYIAIAIASAKEADCHVQLAHAAGFLSREQAHALRHAIANLAPRLVRLLAAVRQNAKQRTKPKA